MIKDKFMNEFPGHRHNCILGPRPCPWLRCKEHLFWLRENIGAKKENTIEKILGKYTDEEILEIIFTMSQTCSLDALSGGEKTLEEIGEILGITRERVRQIESAEKGNSALKKLRLPKRMAMIKDFQ